ncbi:MAG: glycosyltransferase family 4 protein [Planctomycetota bacterium]|jgi:glycosyltransferase involved in cell wall biosynthesis|nr:glycosyltransferase family 4 protein [Planctomycetota bacterium]MDP6988540.1 glycosyltransferase family 4 protein [Planctomycetota bacterium]
MRVLITSPVFPPDLGGPAVYVPSLGRYLVERGHQVKVIAFCSQRSPSGHPFEVEAIPRGFLPLRYLKAFLAVWRAAPAADVVYVQEHLALLHVLAARLRRTPTVIRIMVDGAWEIAHRKGWCGDDDIVAFQARSYGWGVGLTRALQRTWWRWCTRIISCSEFLRQILIQSHGVEPAKVRRIFNAYHGPDPDTVAPTPPDARGELGLDPQRRVVLTICRLMVWKGVDGILEAMAELPADVDLLVAGDGDMEESWKALAERLGLGERVRFLGNVPHERIPLLIRAADVFVLNSRYEGLSHTLLEVLQFGTPMVVSRVCGNPEVVEDGVNGLLVDPGDPPGLARAIARLLDDGELVEAFAENNRTRRELFSREGTFAEVLEVLDAAAAPGGADSPAN